MCGQSEADARMVMQAEEADSQRFSQRLTPPAATLRLAATKNTKRMPL